MSLFIKGRLECRGTNHIMPPDPLSSLQIAWLVIVDTLTLFVLLVGLFGLIVPVFPGLTVMWLATLVYALLQHTAGRMTGWGWFAFAVITILMIGGNVVDNIIITAKMRDRFIPWGSILIAFAAGILASIFFTPLTGLFAAPLGLFLAELRRLKNQNEAWESTKAYMIGWGWAFGARFIIGLVMIGSWMLWAWA
jgi:uncharacterized protein YqgC (DUF456 family)